MPESADSIHVLPLGKMHTTRAMTMQGGSDDPVTIPVPAFLITSGDRCILVDTGLSPEGIEDPEAKWGKLAKLYVPEIAAEDALESRLAQLDLTPGDITDVVLTHLHYDHAGGVALFPDAKRWVQLTEFRAALYPERHYAGGYYPDEFGDGYELLAGDATIAPGVHVLYTPGHTHGHQSVLVRIGDRFHCLTGDVVDDREILDRKRMPAVVVDIDAQIRSAARLRLLESALGAQLIFSHDGEQHAGLPALPSALGT